MIGYLVALGCISVLYIGKAILDAICFKDRQSARDALFYWLLSAGSLALAFGFSLLIDHLS